MKSLLQNLTIIGCVETGMESARDKMNDEFNFSGASLEAFSPDDSLQDISITEEIAKMATSSGGAFDGTKVKSKFEFNCNETDWLKNVRMASDKRFERGLGTNLVNSDSIILKPVSILMQAMAGK